MVTPVNGANNATGSTSSKSLLDAASGLYDQCLQLGAALLKPFEESDIMSPAEFYKSGDPEEPEKQGSKPEGEASDPTKAKPNSKGENGGSGSRTEVNKKLSAYGVRITKGSLTEDQIKALYAVKDNRESFLQVLRGFSGIKFELNRSITIGSSDDGITTEPPKVESQGKDAQKADAKKADVQEAAVKKAVKKADAEKVKE